MNATKKSGIGLRNWFLILGIGMVGQLCWNVENQWFNTFIYEKIGPYPEIISWMMAISALATTFATFLVGTLSDRKGKRRPFIFIGYILWGIFTIAFGIGEFIPKNPIIIASIFVIAMDALMSFCGSIGNDAGFSAWTTDITNIHNRGQLGAAIAAMPVLATILGTVVSGIIIEKLDYFTFFIIIGVFVMVVGGISLIFLKESPTLMPKIDEKGFWHQFGSVFNFKVIKNNKELMWVFLVLATFFIGFNVYFGHFGNYFISTLGYSIGDAGLIQGVGLLIAVLFTIPAAIFINKGKSSLIILIAVILNVIGLVIIFLNQELVGLVIGIVLAGGGYVLVLQTTTAWVKNLYPEKQRGQFEGVRLIFYVCIPMVFGPTIGAFLVNTWGIDVVINGVAGKSPSELLFLVSAGISALTLIPLIWAHKAHKSNILAKAQEVDTPEIDT